ncbi:hypothetical protein AOQ84DRAFT_380310 [Glonium stellatum]|uniref:Uncharacterized protein n=1 Tax=Glonium stellatum TaxID=574774 RepID=A0A8E2EUS3_9PEZI|nr:hypothetical protein AOQ84DRAFT_380310 [Glonium stellatum]
MDMEVTALHRTTDNNLDVQSKIKVVFKGKANEHLQKVIERQVSALTLLLTACNCLNISEQKNFLEKPTSRKILQRVRDGSSSLGVLRDKTSLCSKCTDNLSKISMVFPFDRVLFETKVYERALRASLKEILRRRQDDARLKYDNEGSEPEEQAERSSLINSLLDNVKLSTGLKRPVLLAKPSRTYLLSDR